MEPDKTSRPSMVGYLLVLLGVAGWVVSCFLPLYRIAEPAVVRITLYRQISFGSIGTKLGGLLYLFGGIVAIGVISILGVRGVRRWTTVLLAGAVVSWSLTLLGLLISIGGSFGQVSAAGSSFGVGYWCCWVSMACVVVGTVMVLVSAQRGAP